MTSISVLRDRYFRYVTIVATGGGYYDKSSGDSVIAFALPQVAPFSKKVLDWLVV
jgi:glucose dehydrogenase